LKLRQARGEVRYVLAGAGSDFQHLALRGQQPLQFVADRLFVALGGR
jgi:hypothetical protein